MGFGITIRGSNFGDCYPRFEQTYTICDELNKVCPILSRVIFTSLKTGEANPHQIKYSDKRLRSTISEIDRFLGGYKPNFHGRNLSSVMAVVDTPDSNLVGTLQKGVVTEGLNPKTSAVKSAAYQLRGVILYAMRRKKDLDVD